MAAAGVRPDPAKQALAWAVEKAGRLKPNVWATPRRVLLEP
jgi:hypothetical protein